jgi:hypothetical protein
MWMGREISLMLGFGEIVYLPTDDNSELEMYSSLAACFQQDK